MNNKIFTNIFIYVFFLSFIVGVESVKGQILTENFEYGATNGALTALSGGNWVEQGGPTTPLVGYDNGSLTFGSYPSLVGKATFGTAGQDVYRQFADVTSGVLYAGFILKINTVQTTGDYFTHFSNNGTSFQARVFARTKTGGYELGIAKGGTGGTTAVYNATSTTLTLGTTYFVVIKYDFGTNTTDVADDIASLFVFASSVPLTEPGTSEIQALAGTGILTELRRFAIRQGNSANAPTGELDYIRVGTTWASVTAATATPTLTTIPNSLSGFNTNVGTASASQSYNLSGTDLIGFPGDITVTAPASYEVSLAAGSGYASSINVPFTSATLASTPIFVRIAASAGVGSPTGNVSNAGGGASTQNVAVSGTVNPLTPNLVASPATLSGFSTTIGTVSASQSYNLSGTNLTGFPSNITVTAPASYEVSLTAGSGYANSINVPFTSATLASTPIFVRISASAGVGSPTGNVSNAGGGAPTQNVAVSGTVNAVASIVPISSIRNALDGTGAQVAPYANGTVVKIQGQIYGVNRNLDLIVANGTKQKFEFTVIDNSVGRNGVVIRSVSTIDIAPVDLTEGDNVTVDGTISQFNGLTQITATAVTRNSTGAARKTPINATIIGEEEESQFIRLTGATVTTWPATWTGSGQNVTISVGANVYMLRVTAASELWNKSLTDVFGVSATLPVNNVTIVGLGGQFDNLTPFDSGYQIFVYKLSDIAVAPAAIPTISTNALISGLNFGNTPKNEVSASQTYKLIGKDLPTTGASTITIINVPNNFQVSKNNTDFLSSVSFTNAELNAAGVAGLNVFVRFAPTSEIDGAKGGDVTHSTQIPNSPTLIVNVAVTGIQTAPLAISKDLASKVNIYPNPTVGTIHIDAPVLYQVTITDIRGRKLISFYSNEKVDLNAMPNGTYLLIFQNENGTFAKRLVIQK